MIDRRGIVLNVDELHEHMLQLLEQSGLNVLGLHNWSADGRLDRKIDELIAFMHSDEGFRLKERLSSAGIGLEYEVHAMSWLLPRGLFSSRPHLFRMNEKGDRTPDANCCPTNDECMETIQENSIKLAKMLAPTTHRYFMWQDDAKLWCGCPDCRELSSSDQNLLIMNRIVEALRSVDPHAKLAFLAYLDTLEAVPSVIKPLDGVFLEIAGPQIHNLSDAGLQRAHQNTRFQQAVSDYLDFFGADDAHVLEYWLDASLQSGWKKPAVRLKFDAGEIEKEISFYASQGFRSVTTFGVFLDEPYFRQHGAPPIKEYGSLLLRDAN